MTKARKQPTELGNEENTAVSPAATKSWML
jgi:hypothetical protein